MVEIIQLELLALFHYAGVAATMLALGLTLEGAPGSHPFPQPGWPAVIQAGVA
jgi:hypothetical protein